MISLLLFSPVQYFDLFLHLHLNFLSYFLFLVLVLSLIQSCSYHIFRFHVQSFSFSQNMCFFIEWCATFACPMIISGRSVHFWGGGVTWWGILSASMWGYLLFVFKGFLHGSQDKNPIFSPWSFVSGIHSLITQTCVLQSSFWVIYIFPSGKSATSTR